MRRVSQLFYFLIGTTIVSCSESNPEPARLFADFDADVDEIFVGQSVSFSDLSEGEPTTWEWRFQGGDPATSSQQNPTITYNTTGSFQVSLTIGNGQFETTSTEMNYITVTEVPDTIPPVPCFEFTIEREGVRCPEIMLVFDASCTNDNVDAIEDVEVRWDFQSDGAIDTGFDTAKLVSFTPSFNDFGNLSVTLEARDLSGNVSSITQQLDETGLPSSPDLIAGNLTITTVTFNNDLDTVSVGQEFSVGTNYRCFGDFSTFDSWVLLDGESFIFWRGSCSGGGGCIESGSTYSIDEPGTYELYFELDVFDQAMDALAQEALRAARDRGEELGRQ